MEIIKRIRFGLIIRALTTGEGVLLWTEDGETWAVTLTELAEWIKATGERLSDETSN